MPFPESVKLEAKQQANFRCVVCHEPWVEVHHIIPQADQGPDTIDNAAPLCGSCHNRYGGNRDLQKQLTEMRDHWWQRCSEAVSEPGYVQMSKNLDELRGKYVSGQADQNRLLGEVKDLLLGRLRSAQTAIESASSVSDVLATSSSMSTGVAYTGGTEVCPKCGAISPGGFSQCGSCGQLLR